MPVSIHSHHMSVYVPQRKNDQYQEGHTAFLARTDKATCPVAVTERLIKLLPQSSSAFTLVRRIVKARSKEYFHSSLGVSVSTLREEFLALINRAGGLYGRILTEVVSTDRTQ